MSLSVWIEKTFLHPRTTSNQVSKGESERPGLPTLPPKIWHHIFSLLNKNDLPSARLVNRSWSLLATFGALKCKISLINKLLNISKSPTFIEDPLQIETKSQPKHYVAYFEEVASWDEYWDAFQCLNSHKGYKEQAIEWLEHIKLMYDLHEVLESAKMLSNNPTQQVKEAKEAAFAIKHQHYKRVFDAFKDSKLTDHELNHAIAIYLILSYLDMLSKKHDKLKELLEVYCQQLLKGFNPESKNLLFSLTEEHKKIWESSRTKYKNAMISFLLLDLFLDYFHGKLEQETSNSDKGVPLHSLLTKMLSQWHQLTVFKRWGEMSLNPSKEDRLFVRLVPLTDQTHDAIYLNKNPFFKKEDLKGKIVKSSTYSQKQLIDLTNQKTDSVQNESTSIYISESQLIAYNEPFGTQKANTFYPLQFCSSAVRKDPTNEKLNAVALEIMTQAINKMNSSVIQSLQMEIKTEREPKQKPIMLPKTSRALLSKFT